MARKTASIARKSTGGKAPRIALASLQNRSAHHSAPRPPIPRQEMEEAAPSSLIATAGPVQQAEPLLVSKQPNDSGRCGNLLQPSQAANKRAATEDWSKEEMKHLLDIEHDVAQKNISSFLDSPLLRVRGRGSVKEKLKQLHEAAVKALDAEATDAKSIVK